MNIIKDIRCNIISHIGQAIYELYQIQTDITLEIPKDKSNGDFSSNAAMLLVRALNKNGFKLSPMDIAKAITAKLSENMPKYVEGIETAGAGFINFRLNAEWMYKVLEAIEAMGDDYGRTDMGNGKRVLIEFVSANPTGPMHLGNARGGALGDCLASVMEMAGYNVTREFYINDTGAQIEKLGMSLEVRYVNELGGNMEFPEDGYQGEDIIDIAKEYIKHQGDSLLSVSSVERREALSEFALSRNIETMKKDLERYRIIYDIWFKDSSLYDNGQVAEVIGQLKDGGFTYEKDGAIWLCGDKLDIDKDEVLIRQNGIPTYFAVDIAYHKNKLIERGFDMAINIWGADHHGHVARMKKVMNAIGADSDRLTVILIQLVRLMQNGEAVRMSKRTGKSITLNDLLDEISIDAARFFFNMRSAATHLDFDLDLAKRQNSDNPVYYAQYAHARICSIIRQMNEVDIPKAINPYLLKTEPELELLRKLCELPEEINKAALSLDPSGLTRYILTLAALFHSFYGACRVKQEDEELMKARLYLIACTRRVIANVLSLMKVDAPEVM